jgi:hypothetical protein
MVKSTPVSELLQDRSTSNSEGPLQDREVSEEPDLWPR